MVRVLLLLFILLTLLLSLLCSNSGNPAHRRVHPQPLALALTRRETHRLQLLQLLLLLLLRLLLPLLGLRVRVNPNLFPVGSTLNPSRLRGPVRVSPTTQCVNYCYSVSSSHYYYPEPVALAGAAER